MKRLLSLMLVLVMVLTTFTACQKAGTSEEKLKEIWVKEGKLVMVTKSGDFPPYIRKNDKGEFEGIDVEIAKVVAKKLDRELEVISVDSGEGFASPIAALKGHGADIAMGEIAAGDDEMVNYSDLYDTAQYVLMVVDGSPITSKEDLEIIKRIGAPKGTALFDGCSGKCGVNRMVGCADENDAIAQLAAGKVQCAIVSEETATAACEKNEKLILCEDAFTYETKNADGRAVMASARAVVTEEKYNSLSLIVNGYLIGTTDGTPCGKYCRDTYGDDRVVAYINGATVMQALLTGKVDCAILDDQPAKTYQRASEHLKILEEPCAKTTYTIAMNKDNDELNKAVNEVLKKMKEDGSLDKILSESKVKD